MATGEAIEKHHPKEPHVYLFTIGTCQAVRGKGLGKAMFPPVLAAADKAGLPVYPENSNLANHGFYSTHGAHVARATASSMTFPIDERVISAIAMALTFLAFYPYIRAILKGGTRPPVSNAPVWSRAFLEGSAFARK
ncbi:GNAT family N-acetyltransferase [Henriciella sp. AS95]|uniref:GNAT family N-acetyltransferase n=1 Tax=Henriciella sp. AS95 TaxID=3135782 RepID=UPI00317A79AF